jgi:mannose-6-phosphate isomerase-like protein (cupin superfamily)
VGFAAWPAGGVDRLHPHDVDEVYQVESGRGSIRVAGEDRSVGPGSIVYVAAKTDHRFHSIEVELRVLVLWAPPQPNKSAARGA